MQPLPHQITLQPAAREVAAEQSAASHSHLSLSSLPTLRDDSRPFLSPSPPSRDSGVLRHPLESGKQASTPSLLSTPSRVHKVVSKANANADTNPDPNPDPDPQPPPLPSSSLTLNPRSPLPSPNPKPKLNLTLLLI